MEAKDEILSDERRVNRDMGDEIHTKNEEIKMLIERMEAYRKHKESEIAKLSESKR